MMLRLEITILCLFLTLNARADAIGDAWGAVTHAVTNPGETVGNVVQTTVKGIQDAGKYLADGVHQGGGYLGQGVNQGMGALGKGLGDVMHGPFQLIDGAGKWTQAGLDQFSTAIGDGLGAYAKFCKQRAEEFKEATPFIARMYACVVTVCLSEVQLKQDMIELRHKQENDLQDLKNQLDKAGKDEKKRLADEYIGLLTNVVSDLANQTRVYHVETGYFYDFHFRVLSELDKRKTLLAAGEAITSAIEDVTKNDPNLQKLTKFAATDKDVSDQNFLKYYKAVDRYAKAVGVEVGDTLALIVKGIDQNNLEKLSTQSFSKAQSIQKSLDLLTKELATKSTELETYKKLYQPAAPTNVVAKGK